MRGWGKGRHSLLGQGIDLPGRKQPISNVPDGQ